MPLSKIKVLASSAVRFLQIVKVKYIYFVFFLAYKYVSPVRANPFFIDLFYLVSEHRKLRRSLVRSHLPVARSARRSARSLRSLRRPHRPAPAPQRPHRPVAAPASSRRSARIVPSLDPPVAAPASSRSARFSASLARLGRDWRVFCPPWGLPETPPLPRVFSSAFRSSPHP
ncbi:hypothetical protein KSP39_PZI018003 [Platanthera zijinensis]|uniref:Uncharacterized protein n=1 Tax=Platanthera zijinensis TaxID=2320716 RepID=A0AAP0FYZ1_9ASPA